MPDALDTQASGTVPGAGYVLSVALSVFIAGHRAGDKTLLRKHLVL